MSDFLWKPISENGGNLVVLLDSGSDKTSLIIKGPDGPEAGVYTGRTNGGRPTFRFSRPGYAYPAQSVEGVEISDPSRRNTSSGVSGPSSAGLAGLAGANGNFGIPLGGIPVSEFGPSDEDIEELRNIILNGEEGFTPGDFFGSRPEAILFEPTDPGESQRDAIDDNLQALGAIEQLVAQTNDIIDDEAFDRIRQLVPNFDDSQQARANLVLSQLRGKLPFEDVLENIADRQELSNSIGIPGTNRAATLRDLGLSRRAEQISGASLLSNIIADSERISPVGNRLSPAAFFQDPSDRITTDINQRQLDQASRQSAAFIEASPDPRAVQLFQLRQQQLLGNFNPFQVGNVFNGLLT